MQTDCFQLSGSRREKLIYSGWTIYRRCWLRGSTLDTAAFALLHTLSAFFVSKWICSPVIYVVLRPRICVSRHSPRQANFYLDVDGKIPLSDNWLKTNYRSCTSIIFVKLRSLRIVSTKRIETYPSGLAKVSAHFFPSTYYIRNGLSFFELSFFNALLKKRLLR